MIAKDNIEFNSYWVEVWFKNSKIPMINYNLSLIDATRLFDSTCHHWSVKRLGNNKGDILKEEKK